MGYTAPETTRLGTLTNIRIKCMHTIPERFYRVSVKALILNEARDAFLICKEDNGKWELPGGGLEWDADIKSELAREVREEMGLETTWIADQPSYFFTFAFEHHVGWGANVIYETEVADLDFTPSEECQEIAFVNRDTVRDDMRLFSVVRQLVVAFEPSRHSNQNHYY